MKHSKTTAYATAVLLMIAGVCQAVIQGRNSLDIDFTHPEEAQTKCASLSDKLIITHDGLRWNGSCSGLCNGTIQTKAIGVGLSWRPITGMSCQVVIQPTATTTTRPDGHSMPQDPGMVYVRYSPDRKHWSSWQALQREDSSRSGVKREGCFSGTVAVPRSEHEEYGRYVSEYSTLDVPWTSDEEGVVKWALARDPDLFERHLPFIGFVEFRFEANFREDRRITSFHVTMGWGVSGIQSPPKAGHGFTDRGEMSPWRFVAEESTSTGSRPASQPSDATIPDPFRNRLNIVEKVLRGGNVLKAMLELERIKKELPSGNPSLTERLSTLEGQLTEEMKKQEVEIGKGYLWVHKPEGESSPPPRTDSARHILEYQGRLKAPAGVMMLRIRIERPGDESRVTVTTREVNILHGGGGTGSTQQMMDGELITLGAGDRWGSRHGTMQIGSLLHAPISLEIIVPDNQVVYAGELLVRALPPGQFGKLLVRVIPEPGLSLENAHVFVGRPYVRPGGGGYGLRPDGTCLIEGLGAGPCQVCVDRPEVLSSPRVAANVATGSTNKVELHAFARRRVTFDWKRRARAGQGEWISGSTTIVTGQPFRPNEWGRNRVVFELSEWYETAAKIRYSYGRLLPAEAEDFDTPRLRASKDDFVRGRNDEHSIEVGKVFAVRYESDPFAKIESEALIRIRSIEPAVPIAAKATGSSPTSRAEAASPVLHIDLSLEDGAIASVRITDREKHFVRHSNPGQIDLDVSELPEGQHYLGFSSPGYTSQSVSVVRPAPAGSDVYHQIKLCRERFVVMRYAFNKSGAPTLSGKDVKEGHVAVVNAGYLEFFHQDWLVRQKGEQGEFFCKMPYLQFHRIGTGFGFIEQPDGSCFGELQEAPQSGYECRNIKAVKGTVLMCKVLVVGYGKILIEDVTETPPPGVQVIRAPEP